eukprot:3176902-Lingulodinium_polyedra.AAC.1
MAASHVRQEAGAGHALGGLVPPVQLRGACDPLAVRAAHPVAEGLQLGARLGWPLREAGGGGVVAHHVSLGLANIGL